MTSEPVFSVRKRVDFADTDLAGIVHFANFFRYMENAEHAYYRSLGFSVHPQSESGGHDTEPSSVAWPRVSASCQYKKPLRFEQEFTIEIRIVAMQSKTIEYEFRFLADDDVEPAAVGHLTIICVRFDEKSGRMRAVSIPESIRTKIETSMTSQC